MVYLGRWIVGKVCQGHHIFRDESQWVAFSLATGSREKKGKRKEGRKEEVTCSCSTKDDQQPKTDRCLCGLLNSCGGTIITKEESDDNYLKECFDILGKKTFICFLAER